MAFREYNFDGLIGPTHNYAGLSFGNIASAKNMGAPSNPREAALQGLEKMRGAIELGLPARLYSPIGSPSIIDFCVSSDLAAAMGQSSKRHTEQTQEFLRIAMLPPPCGQRTLRTIAPSPDTTDGKVHITTANLAANFHRSIEAPTTARLLKLIFGDERFFVHHAPLPHHNEWGD